MKMRSASRRPQQSDESWTAPPSRPLRPAGTSALGSGQPLRPPPAIIVRGPLTEDAPHYQHAQDRP